MDLESARSTLDQDIKKDQQRKRMDEAIEVLRSRGALSDNHCPECNAENWNVDFLAIPSVPLPEALEVPTNVRLYIGISNQSSYIPALTFVCTNCGYFKIFNLSILGLGGR